MANYSPNYPTGSAAGSRGGDPPSLRSGLVAGVAVLVGAAACLWRSAGMGRSALP